jgi:hypothetical protein
MAASASVVPCAAYWVVSALVWFMAWARKWSALSVGHMQGWTPRAGLNMGRPVPQKPTTAVRGREPIDAPPIRDRAELLDAGACV